MTKVKHISLCNILVNQVHDFVTIEIILSMNTLVIQYYFYLQDRKLKSQSKEEVAKNWEVFLKEYQLKSA